MRLFECFSDVGFGKPSLFFIIGRGLESTSSLRATVGFCFHSSVLPSFLNSLNSFVVRGLSRLILLRCLSFARRFAPPSISSNSVVNGWDFVMTLPPLSPAPFDFPQSGESIRALVVPAVAVP